MGRTQIYLGDEERAILDRVAEATGASRSELIRRAIRNTFADRMTKADRVRVVEATAGAWRDRPQSGTEYVDAIRGDLNERLRKLGLA